MQLSFVETMSGTVLDARGGEHPISFAVCAVDLGGGHFTLKGVVTAPPWATQEVNCEGTLTIALRPAAITYHLTFAAGGETSSGANTGSGIETQAGPEVFRGAEIPATAIGAGAVRTATAVAGTIGACPRATS